MSESNRFRGTVGCERTTLPSLEEGGGLAFLRARALANVNPGSSREGGDLANPFRISSSCARVYTTIALKLEAVWEGES